jgi:hypothetical protein
MSTTKTLSTRVNEKVYNSMIDFANEEGQTISQVLHQLVDDRIQLSKDMKEYDSSQCSIDSDTKKESTKSPIFSQDRYLEEELKSLEKKNIRVIERKGLQAVIDEVANNFSKHIVGLNKQIQDLTTTLDKKLEGDELKKGMACFDNNKSCFTT